jgi:hypothetical protein
LALPAQVREASPACRNVTLDLRQSTNVFNEVSQLDGNVAGAKGAGTDRQMESSRPFVFPHSFGQALVSGMKLLHDES